MQSGTSVCAQRIQLSARFGAPCLAFQRCCSDWFPGFDLVCFRPALLVPTPGIDPVFWPFLLPVWFFFFATWFHEAFRLTTRICFCEQFTVWIIKETSWTPWEWAAFGPRHGTEPCHEFGTFFHRFVGQLPFCWLVPELQHPAAGRGVWAAVCGRQRSSVRAQHHQHLHSRGPQSESAHGFPPYCCTGADLGLVGPFDWLEPARLRLIGIYKINVFSHFYLMN